MDDGPKFPKGASTWTQIDHAVDWLTEPSRWRQTGARPPVPRHRPARGASTSTAAPFTDPALHDRVVAIIRDGTLDAQARPTIGDPDTAPVTARTSNSRASAVRRMPAAPRAPKPPAVDVPFIPGTPSVRTPPPEPTLADWLRDISDTIDPRNVLLGMIGREAYERLPNAPRLRDVPRLAKTALEWSPAGDVLDIWDGGRLFADGVWNLDPAKMARGAAMQAIGFLVGPAVPWRPAQAFKSAGGTGYHNPKPLPQRPFYLDYPQALRSDHGRPLELDIDGKPLRAPLVAGRRVVGGNDQGLTPKEISQAVNDYKIAFRVVGKKELGDNVLGMNESYGKPGNELRISILRQLKPNERARIVAHELGHILDMSSDFETKGIERELRQIYHDLATRRQGQTTNLFGPEQVPYHRTEVPRELAAEAFRAYMVDPNYMKTVAPMTARRIREYFNRWDDLTNVIQFNTIAPLIGGGLAAGAVSTQHPPTDGDDDWR